jgi:hypothetical protein
MIERKVYYAGSLTMSVDWKVSFKLHPFVTPRETRAMRLKHISRAMSTEYYRTPTPVFLTSHSPCPRFVNSGLSEAHIFHSRIAMRMLSLSYTRPPMLLQTFQPQTPHPSVRKPPLSDTFRKFVP